VTLSQGAPQPGSILHRVASVEDAANRVIRRRLSGRGWVPTITGYTGYGAPGWVRVVGRILLSRPDPRTDRRPELVRGWRSFTTVPVSGTEVVVLAGHHRHVLRTDRGGYVDADLTADLPVGWGHVELRVEGAEPVRAPVLVIDPDVGLGIVSDIDDTVMVTALPRPMLAAWNTLVLNEHARRPVPGMAVLYERLVNAHPGAPVVYVSTGAWNVAPTLTRFLGRHLYPAGPILLTDWGPTKDGWFRNGREHKRKSLIRLAGEFPNMRWLLVGDDGQHDPELYSGFARTHPGNVAGVAIRHLSPTEQVLASGLPVPMEQAEAVPDVAWVSGLDGAALSERLRGIGLL
jgi:phosphatidate phosphatase APP1